MTEERLNGESTAEAFYAKTTCNQLQLDLYTNFKHTHSAPAYTVGEGVGEAVGDLIAFSDVM